LDGYYGLNCGQFPPLTDIVAIAAGASAAAIAGIIVGVALALACFGGGSAFAYSQLANDGENQVVSNNPIYRASTNQGDNPLAHHN